MPSTKRLAPSGERLAPALRAGARLHRRAAAQLARKRTRALRRASRIARFARQLTRKHTRALRALCQNDRYSSKFKTLNSKFEFQASFCITNLKHYIYEASAEYGRRGGLHRRENVEKQCKTAFWRQKSCYSSKFKFLNSTFEFQAFFLHY